MYRSRQRLDSSLRADSDAVYSLEFFYVSVSYDDNDVRCSVNYICRDYLGSITHVTDSAGTLRQELSYDAWGRLRNPSTHALYPLGMEPWPVLGRGFTGHEHLPVVGIINMNARLYDSATGRFLSPDPYVQMPDFSQNFNRYSYCMNNPLRYVDKDGEIFWLIPVAIGAAIGAYTGASLQSGTVAFWNWKPDAWKGAIAGAIIGGTIGYGMAGAVGASGMLTPISNSGVSVLANSAGYVSSILNSGTINITMNALSGGSWDSVWKAGLVGFASGAWSVSGGFGMVKGFGSTSAIGKLARKLGYQMIGTAGGSIGDNWARGENPFSRITLGVGPVNLTLGKGQRLFQLQNNIGNFLSNALGLANVVTGGRFKFDWNNLSPVYYGGLRDKIFGAGTGFGTYAIWGDANIFSDSETFSHEMHHLWQSRSMTDLFLPNYIINGIEAELMGGKLIDLYNYYEQIAYFHLWFK